jgi:hypothetical protein
MTSGHSGSPAGEKGTDGIAGSPRRANQISTRRGYWSNDFDFANRLDVLRVSADLNTGRIEHVDALYGYSIIIFLEQRVG